MLPACIEFVLSITAIVVAGLFAIICILFIVIVVIKLKGILPCPIHDIVYASRR